MTARFLTLCAASACLFLAACGGGGSDAPGADTSAGGSRSQAPLAGGGSALPPAPAGLSGNVTCVNMQIGAIDLDSVIVPDNAACALAGTRLNGSIIVGTGARLDAVAVNVNGNVQAEGSEHVALTEASFVGGSVQIKQGGSARVDGIRISGDLQFDAMRDQVTASGNRVGGNVQVVGNRGGAAIDGNTIVGNLQCKENLPAPTGGANVATIKEDQCRDL